MLKPSLPDREPPEPLMSIPDDRIQINMSARTTGVVITLGETTLSVNMPTPTAGTEMSDEQLRQTILRQLKRVLEVAREELG